MKKLLLITILSVFAFAGFSQSYPEEIPKGESKTFNATEKALWVLTESQYKNAITKAKNLKLAEEQIKLLEEKAAKMGNKSGEQDSLVNTLTKDRDYYKKNWDIAEEDIQTLSKQLKKQKLYTKLSLGGGLAGIILAIIFI